MMRALRALTIVVAALLLTVAVAAAVDVTAFLHVYAKRFAFVPGAWFAEHLAATTGNPSATCLIVGGSTAREDFDSAVFNAKVPAVPFVDAATTGPNSEVIEIQAQIIARYGLHYRCVVLGMHPWMMFSKPKPDLAEAEYLPFLRPRDLLALSRRPWETSPPLDIARTQILPLARHADQLNRIVRWATHRARVWFTGRPMPLERYERFPGELAPEPDFHYPPSPNYLKEDRARVDGWLKPYRDSKQYGHEEESRSLRRALELLVEHSDTLFVVHLPDTVLVDVPNTMARPAYDAVMRSFAGRLVAIDCRGDLSEDLFIDHTHLNAAGRQLLSDAVARLIADRFAPSASQPSVGPCRT
jgi:hypothetical protein